MSTSQADQFERHVTKQLSKMLGALPLLLPIFRRLRVVETVNAHCPGKETVSHGLTTLLLGLNRLMAPKPLYKVHEWLTDTVLEDTLGISADQMYDVRLGRTLDDLHADLQAIWQDIVVQAVLAYDLDLRFLHYDITSIYFEGEYAGSDQISYGYSRDHRPDAKQINLGLNVTGEDGIPLGYRVLAGRVADRSTPLENLQALRELLDRPELAGRAQDFLLVSDQAMLDQAVIVAYAEKGVHWLGPLHTDPGLQEIVQSVSNAELAEQPLDYRPTNQPRDEPLRYHGVLRPAIITQDGQQVAIQVLVVKSVTKVKLDRDRRQTYLERLTKRLAAIQGLLNQRRYKKKAYTLRQIEKARQGNPVQDLVEIVLSGQDGQLALSYQIKEAKLAAAEALDGRYLLGTNEPTLTAVEMLTRFKAQEVVERRIKVVKGPVRVRPLFLHKPERVAGLVFVAMLALLVYTILEMLCRRAGQWITARQVLEKFERLGAIYLQFSDGSQMKLPSALNPTQQQLLDLLRFPQPEMYLRPPEGAP
jgi:transposase